MSLLEGIVGPDDLRRLPAESLPTLATEIRDFLVAEVSRTGGHLGPNLGAVELTLAVHRVFRSPHDRIIWDTGHQAYVHKLVTGRASQFGTLRRRGGLSGYPSRSESDHDIVENSHASASLSWADGIATALDLRGEGDRVTVAIIGDGALTGGMAWEALNNIAAAKHRRVVVVVNDNGRSYAPTAGAFADRLASLRLMPGYEQMLDGVKHMLGRTPVVGPPIYGALHGMKKGVKDLVAPQAMFEDLGMKYVGPIDGHDIAALEVALRRARDFGGPVIVHAVTRKGYGYSPSENDEADRFHAVPVIDPITGRPVAGPVRTFTDVVAEELVAIGAERTDVVAITAAMLLPTGLGPFASAYPERVKDVGIAEQHAVTAAAGLAFAGMKPVVAVYSTFLNRAFDQVLMDVALHRAPVTLLLDRAGVTGDDGASHNGMWDLSLLSMVPGMAVAAPRDEPTLRRALREAIDVADHPTAVRFPKGAIADDITAVRTDGDVDVLRACADADVLIITAGTMAALGCAVADGLADQGVGADVVDPRWILPISPDLIRLAAGRRLVVSIEDSGRIGGVGAALAVALADAGITVPLEIVALPQQFFDHARRGEILDEIGLEPRSVTRVVLERLLALDSVALPEPATPATD